MEEITRPNGKDRCAVYVDGFNAYYGVFKHRPATKWLNVQSYFEDILAPADVVLIRYFTAIIEATNESSLAKSQRQTVYMVAIRSLPKVKVVLGKFQTKKANCFNCFGTYEFPQEKKTDVNIALAMTVDAVGRAYDSMVLVSGDSDLHPVCLWIKQNRPEIKLRVFIPSIPEEEGFRRADYLTGIGVPWSFLPITPLASHQFPDPIPLKFGSFPKPTAWA